MLISFFFLFFLVGNYSRLREYVPCSKLVQSTDKRVRRLKNKFFTVQFVLPLDTRNSFYEK